MSNLSCGTHVAEPTANIDCRKLLNQSCRFLPKLKLPISADAKLPLTVLGYYMRRYPMRLHAIVFSLLLFVPFAACLLAKLRGLEVDFYSVFGYLSIFCVMMCVAWWQMVMQFVQPDRMSMWAKKWLEDFSNCSFGIYLIHIFIMRRVIWHFAPLENTPHYTILYHVYCDNPNLMGNYIFSLQNKSGGIFHRI